MDGLRRRRISYTLAAALAMLLGIGWSTESSIRAGRYADRIAASGVEPYAPAGWTPDGAGSLSGGRLRYAMHDGAGRHVLVTVRAPVADETGLAPYQQAVLKKYGVVVSIRALRVPDPDAMPLPDAIAAAMSPQDERWLANRLCWSCRLEVRLEDSGILFG